MATEIQIKTNKLALIELLNKYLTGHVLCFSGREEPFFLNEYTTVEGICLSIAKGLARYGLIEPLTREFDVIHEVWKLVKLVAKPELFTCGDHVIAFCLVFSFVNVPSLDIVAVSGTASQIREIEDINNYIERMMIFIKSINDINPKGKFEIKSSSGRKWVLFKSKNQIETTDEIMQ